MSDLTTALRDLAVAFDLVEQDMRASLGDRIADRVVDSIEAHVRTPIAAMGKIARGDDDEPPENVHVAIGNSDDRLTQAEWSNFREAVDRAIRLAVSRASGTVHGAWVSPSADRYQNACWAFSAPHPLHLSSLRVTLRLLAERYRQESVAWTEGTPQFLPGVRL